MALTNSPEEDAGASSPASAWFAVREGTLSGCVFTLSFSAIGAGILSLPWAFATLGMGLGVATMLVSAFASYVSMEGLLKAGQELEVSSYPDVFQRLGGRPAEKLLCFVLWLDCFGAVCAFLNYISELATPLLPPRVGGWKVAVIAAVCLCGLFPLSLSRHVTRWANLSALCTLPLLGVVLLTAVALADGREIAGDPHAFCRAAGPDDVDWLWNADESFSAWCKAAAVFFFAFMCHMNIFSVVNDLRRSSPQRVQLTLRLSVAVQFGFYLAVGVPGYLLWRRAVGENVIACWPGSSLAALAVRFALCLMLVVCSVLCLHPAREQLLRLTVTPPSRHASLLDERVRHGDVALSVSNRLLWGVSGVQVALVGLVAVLVPSIVSLLGVLGGFCAVMLIFVFPGFAMARTSGGGAATLVLFAALSCVGLYSAAASVADFVS